MCCFLVMARISCISRFKSAVCFAKVVSLFVSNWCVCVSRSSFCDCSLRRSKALFTSLHLVSDSDILFSASIFDPFPHRENSSQLHLQSHPFCFVHFLCRRVSKLVLLVALGRGDRFVRRIRIRWCAIS